MNALYVEINKSATVHSKDIVAILDLREAGSFAFSNISLKDTEKADGRQRMKSLVLTPHTVHLSPLSVSGIIKKIY